MVFYTKNGQPYIKLKSGKARFIKRSSARHKKRAIHARAARVTRHKKARVGYMAKKHHYRKSGGMGGLKTILKAAMIGAGAYYLTENNVIGGVGGYFLGGPIGAVAGFVAPTIKQYIPKV
jgi:hypothetical protein